MNKEVEVEPFRKEFPELNTTDHRQSAQVSERLFLSDSVSPSIFGYKPRSTLEGSHLMEVTKQTGPKLGPLT